jgi:hypothetical protein
MSAESIMESLNLNYSKKSGDKLVSKYVPHNNFCIDPTEQDLQDLNNLDSTANTNRFNCYQSELEIMRSDVIQLKNETDNLLQKDREVHEHKSEYLNYMFKRDQDMHLAQHEQEALLSLTLEQFEDWCQTAIKLRSDSQARKISMMCEIDKLEKECSDLLSDSSSNMIYRKDGKVFLKFTGASMNTEMPNKRQKEQVALYFVKMMTKIDKLIKICLDPCLDLLKEYRDCHVATDRTYKMFNVVSTRIESDKNSITRYELSQLIYDLLTSERQVEYLASIKMIMENPENKKGMIKLASSKGREISELKQKVKDDGKKVNSFRTKNKLNSWQPSNSNRGKYTQGQTRGYNQKRRGSLRGRGNFSGSFRGQGQGCNRGYQHRNNYNNSYNNGYQNQRYQNNFGNQVDGNNFNNGNSGGHQNQPKNNTRGINNQRGGRGR